MSQDPDFIPADPDFIPAGPSTAPPANAPPIGSIGPQETGVGHYLQGVKSDIETGGTTTMPGRLINWLASGGGQFKPQLGSTSGGVGSAGEQVLAVPFGAMKAAQGVTELPQHPLQGLGHIAGGALQAASEPLAFVGPTAAGELPSALNGTRQMSAAGKVFSQIESQAGKIPIDTTAPGNAALDIQRLAQSGGQMPKVVRDFLKRATDPEQGPITYAEARQFFSNASRLSKDEYDRLTPVMQRGASMFAKALNESITEAAGKVGQADNYITALKQYASGALQSKRYAAGGRLLLDMLKASGMGAAGYAGWKVATGK